MTTLAYALALAAHATLLELDASGGDLTSLLRLPPDPGLVSLAAEVRRNRGADVLGRNAQMLPAGVAVIAAPARPDRASAVLSALAPALPEVLKEVPAHMPIVADLGRLTGPSREFAALTDRLLVLTRPRMPDLVHLEGLAEAVPDAELILMGRGPYPPGEITAALGLPVTAHVRHDPAARALLEGRRHRTRLTRAAAEIAATLMEPARA
ncbi:hypothetical protein DP939_22290 [Spongiactinospora rosea]|uniref:Uncharacterized protein n=1 Tax=Spongiactinospora rosea TaxID=2248750 RepID=A0A366LX36_9ACTN|nr:hypothetical protein [Spongiactinospora rosea]RBQ18093.1 hypothetical protein DP939_22290 [Spongiactinospora rosea]